MLNKNRLTFVVLSKHTDWFYSHHIYFPNNCLKISHYSFRYYERWKMRARLLALFLLCTTWPGDCRLAHHPAHQTNQNDPSTTTPSTEENDSTPASRVNKAHKDTCSKSAECVLPVQCPAHVNEEDIDQCSTAGGREGVCCTTGKNHTGND